MNRRDFIRTTAGATALAPFINRAAHARVSDNGISVRWLGGATMEINIAGIALLTDPCFGEGPEAFEMADPNQMFDPAKGPNVKMHARNTRFPGLSLSHYDAVLLSHAHEDHFDQAAQGWLSDRGPLICAEHDAQNLSAKGHATEILAHGETRLFSTEQARVTVTAVPAVHSTNTDISALLGEGNGYWITAEIDEIKTNIY